jgi:hypothetical protein
VTEAPKAELPPAELPPAEISQIELQQPVQQPVVESPATEKVPRETEIFDKSEPIVGSPVVAVEPVVESLTTVKSAIASPDAAQPVTASSQATGEVARVCNTYRISSRCGTPGGYGAPIIPGGCSTSTTAKTPLYNTPRKGIG